MAEQTKASTIKQRAKVVNLRVSVGNEDTRSMAEFVAEAKAALYAEAGAKNVSSMGEEYIIDGERRTVAEVETDLDTADDSDEDASDE